MLFFLVKRFTLTKELTFPKFQTHKGDQQVKFLKLTIIERIPTLITADNLHTSVCANVVGGY